MKSIVCYPYRPNHIPLSLWVVLNALMGVAFVGAVYYLVLQFTNYTGKGPDEIGVALTALVMIIFYLRKLNQPVCLIKNEVQLYPHNKRRNTYFELTDIHSLSLTKTWSVWGKRPCLIFALKNGKNYTLHTRWADAYTLIDFLKNQGVEINDMSEE